MKLPAYVGTKNDTINDGDNPWLRVLKLVPKLTELSVVVGTKNNTYNDGNNP